MPAHPSKSWTATCAAADGFQESGWQAAGPEEDEVAVVVAFRLQRPKTTCPTCRDIDCHANCQQPTAMDDGSIHRSAPGTFPPGGRQHYSMRAAVLRSYQLSSWHYPSMYLSLLLFKSNYQERGSYKERYQEHDQSVMSMNYEPKNKKRRLSLHWEGLQVQKQQRLAPASTRVDQLV